MNLSEKLFKESAEFFSRENLFDSEKIDSLSKKVIRCWNLGGKIAFMGNGGSASEASHLAAEFVGRCVQDHKPWPAISLNESLSAVTAISNDYGSEFIFSRPVEALLKSNDILIGLSTSGRSPNILRGLEAANKKGVQTILWTGQNPIKLKDTEVWNAPSASTPRIQEVHLLWGHLLAEIIEIYLSDFNP